MASVNVFIQLYEFTNDTIGKYDPIRTTSLYISLRSCRALCQMGWDPMLIIK